ncbi:MAG: hypothetical protein ABI960_08175 [Candidatus Eisenbacteria bacterium]
MPLRSHRAQSLAPAGIVRPGLLLAGLVVLGSLTAFPPGGPGAAEASGKKGEVGLGVFFGGASYDNTQFNDALQSNGYERLESGIEYGFGVDYRLSDWISVGFAAARIGADTTVPLTADSTSRPAFGTHASPLVFSLIAHPLRTRRGNLDVFIGAGPLLNANVSSSSGIFEFEGRRTGTYFHAGGALEYRFSPIVSFSIAGLARRARANNVDLRQVTGDPDARWDLTFNGAAFWVGPRLHFGAID